MTSLQGQQPLSLLSPRAAMLVGVNALGMLLIAGAALFAVLLPGASAFHTLKYNLPTLCVFKAVTHLPCLFCGITRSFVAIAQGDLLLSLRYHLLGIPVYLGILAFSGLSLFNPNGAVAFLEQLRKPLVFGVALLLMLAVWGVKLTQSPWYW